MATPYGIQIEKRALKALGSLPKRIRTRIRKSIDGLADESRPAGVRKLTARVQLYRVRVGNYRVVYQISDQEQLVLVVKIGDRKEIYR